MIPKESLQAVLTDDQKEKLKKGAIELVTKKGWFINSSIERL